MVNSATLGALSSWSWNTSCERTAVSLASSIASPPGARVWRAKKGAVGAGRQKREKLLPEPGASTALASVLATFHDSSNLSRVRALNATGWYGDGPGAGEGGPCVEPKVGRGVPLLGNLGLCLNLDAPSFGRAAGRVAGGTSSNHQRRDLRG